MRVSRPRVTIFLLSITGLLLFSCPQTVADTVTINPRATYLRTNRDPNAVTTQAFSLAGLVPRGGFITLTMSGDESYGFSSGEGQFLGIYGVFSTSDVILPSDQLERIPGAIFVPGLSDAESGLTWNGGLPTDIAEDFLIFDPGPPVINGQTIQVPDGANYLFMAVIDSYYSDNGDRDGDLAMTIVDPPAPTDAPGEPVPEPSALLMVAVGATGLVTKLYRERLARK